MVEYIEYGNIFELKMINGYAHGCNCAGAMGKGIALQFKKKYPKMYIEYNKLCKKSEFNLGSVYVYKNDDGKYIFNLGTQAHWKKKAELGAIGQSINKMLEIASSLQIERIALPKIGAGLGGLEWNEVKNTIENEVKLFPNITLIVVVNFR